MDEPVLEVHWYIVVLTSPEFFRIFHIACCIPRDIQSWECAPLIDAALVLLSMLDAASCSRVCMLSGSLWYQFERMFKATWSVCCSWCCTGFWQRQRQSVLLQSEFFRTPRVAGDNGSYDSDGSVDAFDADALPENAPPVEKQRWVKRQLNWIALREADQLIYNMVATRKPDDAATTAATAPEVKKPDAVTKDNKPNVTSGTQASMRQQQQQPESEGDSGDDRNPPMKLAKRVSTNARGQHDDASGSDEEDVARRDQYTQQRRREEDDTLWNQVLAADGDNERFDSVSAMGPAVSLQRSMDRNLSSTQQKLLQLTGGGGGGGGGVSMQTAQSSAPMYFPQMMYGNKSPQGPPGGKNWYY